MVKTPHLGESFDISMDQTRQYTTQQKIKIFEAYFTTNLVFLTQRQYRKDCEWNSGQNS